MTFHCFLFYLDVKLLKCTFFSHVLANSVRHKFDNEAAHQVKKIITLLQIILCYDCHIYGTATLVN